MTLVSYIYHENTFGVFVSFSPVICKFAEGFRRGNANAHWYTNVFENACAHGFAPGLIVGYVELAEVKERFVYAVELYMRCNAGEERANALRYVAVEFEVGAENDEVVLGRGMSHEA